MGDRQLELNNVIRQLRKELQSAMDETEVAPIRFRLESVDLELKVAAEAVAGGEGGCADGGLKFHVLGLGGGEKPEDERVHTVKVRLIPEGSEGGTLAVSRVTGTHPTVPSGGR